MYTDTGNVLIDFWSPQCGPCRQLTPIIDEIDAEHETLTVVKINILDNMDEARKLIQSLKGKNVIGGDVACLMPTKDNPNNITSMVAASIMFEIICLISINLGNK